MSIKDFQLKKFLGKGSYGSVYMAIRQSDNQQYAVKKVDTRRMNTKERSEAVNEIRVLASVGGPFNIRFLEAFVDADVLYIVTEFAANGDLFGWLKARKGRGMLKEATVWSFLIQMCYGLLSLHERNILHRDLKSANVFMMDDRHLKLGDFGVAKVLKTADALARTQVGTPYYVAPEVWKNKPYNAKCDVWSLGCLLYELLTFKPPFDSNSMDGLARKVMKGRYEPISNAYSADMHALVAKLLVVEQRERPSVEQLLADPLLRKRLELLPPLDALQPPLDEDVDIMRTIHVPRKFTDLKQNLPPSRYATPLNTERDLGLARRAPPPVDARRVASEAQLHGAPRAHAPAGPEALKRAAAAAAEVGLPTRVAADATRHAPPPHPAPAPAPPAGGAAPRVVRVDAPRPPPLASSPHDPTADDELSAALARRQQQRQQQLAAQHADPNAKLPSVFRQRPGEPGGGYHAIAEAPPAQHRRLAAKGAEPSVRLPYLPLGANGANARNIQAGGGYYPPQPPAAASQLRVVRHGGGGRTNVHVYQTGAPEPPTPSQGRYPEYNPITHQRNAGHALQQQQQQQAYRPPPIGSNWR